MDRIVNWHLPSEHPRNNMLEVCLAEAGIDLGILKYATGTSSTSDVRDLFRGITYIDVGCGCVTEYGDGRYPYLVSVAALSGAHAFGIDMYDGPSDAPYTHITSDVMKLNPLNLGELCRVDAANIFVCNGLIELEDEHDTSPAFRKRYGFDLQKLKPFHDRLWDAAFRVLVPDGLFLYNKNPYIKQSNGWEKVW